MWCRTKEIQDAFHGFHAPGRGGQVVDNRYRDDEVERVWRVRKGEIICHDDIVRLVLLGDIDQVHRAVHMSINVFHKRYHPSYLRKKEKNIPVRPNNIDLLIHSQILPIPTPNIRSHRATDLLFQKPLDYRPRLNAVSGTSCERRNSGAHLVSRG